MTESQPTITVQLAIATALPLDRSFTLVLHPSIQGPQADRFRHVFVADAVRLREIRNGARHPEHTVTRASREVQLLHRPREKLPAARREHAVTAQLAHRESLVRLAGPIDLRRPSLDDASADRRGRLGGTGIGVVTHARYLDVQIDPIEKRPRDARAVAQNLLRGTPAGAGRIAESPAWTGIHGRHELESGREARLAACARDGDGS